MARPRRLSGASEMSVGGERQQVWFTLDVAFLDFNVDQQYRNWGWQVRQLFRPHHTYIEASSSLTRDLSDHVCSIGVEFASKIVKVGTGTGKRRVKLQLWDTAGTERFRAVSRSYYRGAAGAILVYDVASISSFNALPTFLLDARALASPNLAVILAGNKSDIGTDLKSTPNAGMAESFTTASSFSSKHSSMPFDSGGTSRPRQDSINLGSNWTATKIHEGREVNTDSATKWASKMGVPVCMEVSALNGDNIEELFTKLAKMILTKIELGEIDPDDPQSGIQYGDGPWDGSSIRSGGTMDDGGTRRRGGKKLGPGGTLTGIQEWEDVFRTPAFGGQRKCC